MDWKSFAKDIHLSTKFLDNVIDANKYPLIFEANKPMLTHPDKIYPGQMLRIPPQ